MTKVTDKLDQILEVTSKITNTPIKILIGKRKTKILTVIRIAIGRVAKNEGFSWVQIASRLKRHRTTLMKMDKAAILNPTIDNLVSRITKTIEDDHFLDHEMENLVWNLAQEWVNRFGERGSVNLTLDLNGWLAVLVIQTGEGDIQFISRAIHPKPWVALLRAYNQAIEDIRKGNLKNGEDKENGLGFHV